MIIAEAGTLIVDGGTLIADEATLDVNGSVVISNGNFSAPGDGQSFTVAKDWTFLGGNFNPNNGRVIFDSSAQTVFTGNATFYNIRSYEYGKIFKFTPGSVQTVEGTFDFRGGPQVNQKISLLSVSEGDTWDIKFPYGEQGVQYLKVQDSNALENDITCFSCTNLLNNNELWLFFALQMNVPAPNRTIDRTPTIIGFAESQTIVTIKGLVNGVLTPIAQTTSDVNGAFRVEATILLDVRADNYLIAFLGGTQGFTVLNLNVVENPTYQEVPTITSHVDGVRLFVDKPTFLGKGLENETVTVVASDIPAWGHLLLSTVGIATVDVNGDYSLMIDTPLPKGLNFISMTVNGVASDILEVKVASPHGVVFDSTTNQPINEAIVSLYRASDNQLATIADGDLDPTDVNPLITGEDGFYSFITADGNYYTRINAAGYDYPSTRTTFSVGRTIVTGSKAETFTSAGPMIIMDHPADANGLILRIEKEANKKEVKIGEVVTYTISIENKTPNLIKSVYLEDKIPPGFKYLQGRVKFNDVSIADPTGNRPLVFYLGDIPSKTKHKLQYQLVVGSGVTVGEYENVAFARYSNGQLLSNRATKIVRVVLDPLFDLGTVMGKVFFDKNENGIQDAPEYSYLDRDTYMEMPVPHARLVMEDGTVVKADETGRFSIPGIKPGRHVIRIDESSLPEGSYLTTDKAVIIDVTPGLMVKVNFGVNMDYNRFKSEDQQFFAQKVHLTQERSKPVARLHATLFNSPIAVYDNVFVNQAEFRIFMNYSAFIDKWRLEILDKDTRKLVKFFEGNRLNINDPIFWDGKILTGEYIDVTRQYVFLVYVENKEKYYDETILFPVSFNILEDEDALKKYQEDQKNQDLPKKYRDWVKNESQKSNIFVQTILVDGEKVVFNRLDRPIQSVRIMKEGALLMDVPLTQGYVLTAKDLLDGKMADDDRSRQQVDFILPKGDYEILVQEGEGTKAFISSENLDLPSSAERVAHTKEMVGSPSKIYTKQIRVGEDYLFFVGMGDAKIGYAVNTGDIEPVQQADKYKGGFYQEGQMAYYLKGKIQGKYLITSSFDTDREQKALFRKLNPDQYYPVYGDASSKDYQATDTQGPLYLLIEWDKSSAQWSNYNVAFEDTEFARFTRSLYGGKVNFESLSTTPYGESRSKVVAFHAQEKQRSAHNEFLATGGSLYYLKHKDIIEGSDKVRVEVRDKITGLVLSSSEMKEGADYEIDYASGRILFWQPVSMMVEAFSIISNDLLKGNLLYVVADYEYDVLEKYDEGSEGVRTRQAIGDHVLVGATYVSETQPTVNYELKGTDVTVHLGKDAKVIAEYAETRSNTIGTFLSTDGGLSFNELATSDDISGRAYGIKYDAKLFNRLGFDAYYKWIDNNFAVVDQTSQQGKELIGFGGVYDFTEKSRLTLRHDIQRLVDNGNLQTRRQLGAQRVATTLMQVVHDMNKLKLTGEYQRKETELSVSNILALKADYLVSDRLILSAAQQASIEGDKNAAQTTLGLTAKPTDKLTLTVQQILAREGAATLLGVKADMTGKFALTADYALEKSKKGLTQTTTTTTSVGMEMKPTEKSVIKTSVGLARANTGEVATTLAVKGISEIQKDTNVEGEIALAGAGATRRSTMALGGSTKLKVDEKTDVESQAKVTSSTDGIDGTSLNLTGTTKADATTTHQSGVTIAQDSAGVQTRTYNFATIKQLNEAFKVISAKSFGEKSDGTHIQDNTYSLVREKDGRKLEGSLKRAYEECPKEISQSNIFGLSGDVNDKWAVTGSVERGTVQNLDGTQTQRSVASVALGYVNKDDEQGTFIKTSTKAEWRVDDGTEDKRQYLLYHALEGKIDNEWSVFSKLEFSKTRNLTRDTTDAQHKEIMLGGAYRPLSHDRLNLIARYTYKEERSPASQTDMAQIEYEDAHVFAMDAIYDLTQQWQLTEKFAYRIMDEKVKGFDFNKTHTWLMIHRLNYRINKDWSIGGEYRVLTQEESADAKTGILLEVTRRIGDYGQLGVGYDFTSFADDLTDLSYKSQGPFMRMTGKFYDRKPEELERAKEKWLEEKIHRWAWVMVEQEFKKKKSPLMQELNEYFILAQKARHKGDWEESQQIYKDIIMAGEMMFQEAVEYIRARVKREERFKEMQSLADQYFKTGQYEKARKILEKILEEARDTMVE
ncbi:MAG TPA: hypothetical protein PLH56_01995 [Candidatus Omnitrophota bacterium]|nr:hypothetical protein [Candidatus Omnitrophota bacterium]